MPMYEKVRAAGDEVLVDGFYDPAGWRVVENPRKARAGYHFCKRVLDILFSGLALLALSPVFIAVAAAIRVDSRGPAIYKQQRVGKDQKLFTMYKFRTMCQYAEAMQGELLGQNERDGPVFKINRDPRVTRVGKLLRKTCIDELPQLVNILRGEMSLVGPRPPLPSEVEKYKPAHLRRLEAKPGLTCYWQVCTDKPSFEEWVALDVQYIRERSMKVDLRLILKTALLVFRLSGDK